jgi:hypothetical protein
MKKRHNNISLLNVFAICIAVSVIMTFTVMAASVEGLTVVADQKGNPIPELTLNNLLEQPVALGDFQGQLLMIGFAAKRGQELSKAIEQYRQRIRTDFTDPEIPFLRVNSIDKSVLAREASIIKKMRKGLRNDATLLQQTLVNFDVSLKLDEKFGVTDPNVPWFFVVGKDGRILLACSGWYSEENFALLKQELLNILDMGEEAYLSSSDVALGK